MDGFLLALRPLSRQPGRAEHEPNSAGRGEMERGQQVEETGAETTGSWMKYRREEKD